MSLNLSVDNVGPIQHVEVTIAGYGVTVLEGANGTGKSTLLSAVQAAARGKGALPLRDAAKSGKVSVAGATITLGKATRHTGTFEVENIEGKFSLDDLVDPHIQSPASADAARIKALIGLMGVEAKPELFSSSAAFPDFQTVVSPESLKTADLVEMARRIKADYDAKAREQETIAEREEQHAVALSAEGQVDATVEHDADVLLERANACARAKQDLQTRLEQWRSQKDRADAARASLAVLNAAAVEQRIEEASFTATALSGRLEAIRAKIADLRKQLQESEAEEEKATQAIDAALLAKTSAEKELGAITAAKKIVDEFSASQPVSDADVAAAAAEFEAAKLAIDVGAKIRSGMEAQARAEKHRRAASEARETAAKFRDAGKATDDVLSEAIKTDILRVESDGKSARLVCTTERDKSEPFHELSPGKKWRLAFTLGCNVVGENGLLVISQDGWEGLDVWTQKELHALAVEHKVYCLTAQATKAEDGSREISSVPFHAA